MGGVGGVRRVAAEKAATVLTPVFEYFAEEGSRSSHNADEPDPSPDLAITRVGRIAPKADLEGQCGASIPVAPMSRSRASSQFNHIYCTRRPGKICVTFMQHPGIYVQVSNQSAQELGRADNEEHVQCKSCTPPRSASNLNQKTSFFL